MTRIAHTGPVDFRCFCGVVVGCVVSFRVCKVSKVFLSCLLLTSRKFTNDLNLTQVKSVKEVAGYFWKKVSPILSQKWACENSLHHPGNIFSYLTQILV